MNSETKKIITGTIVGIATGIIIGGALGLLFAPQSGEETRKVIKENASVVRDKAGRFASKVKNKLNYDGNN